MDYELLKIVGAVAGIGGVSVACVAYIFREIIRKEIFPKLNRKDAFRLLNRIITLIFIIGVLGILAYVAVSFKNGNGKSDNTVTNTSIAPTNANQNSNIQNSSQNLANNTITNNAHSSVNAPARNLPIFNINKKRPAPTKPKQTPTPSGIIQENLEKAPGGGQND